MLTRAQELCRKLKPVLGRRIDGLWAAYLAGDADGRAGIEQTLELLAAKHLGQDFQPDRAPFPPPSRTFATRGDIPVGLVLYGGRPLYPFSLRSTRLKEHLLICGRSGSGKTNLTFVLLDGIMKQGIHVLALDWKRGYRDLRQTRADLRVFTVGRDVAPIRFNPFIPPPGCEPHVWLKLAVDVIASAYLGGEGVISLLVAGLDHLFQRYGCFGPQPGRWPTVAELLTWLRSTKLHGRAALWQASAERILLAMTYGEFGAVLDTQSNDHIQQLLAQNVVLEMDGLSSAADRAFFSEVLTLYLYRYRLAQGPRAALTNVIVLEEAHHLLLAKAPGTQESVLESSIRMIRQYGIGYVFVDQSASLLSKVAFANSYATLALSQKLRADVQSIAGAMNLTDEQRDALSTLAIGTVVVRLADEHPEPFLVGVPRSAVREGAVSDDEIRQALRADSTDSGPPHSPAGGSARVPAVPTPDEKAPRIEVERPHPPAPQSDGVASAIALVHPEVVPPPEPELSREAIRFLADVAGHPLSSTVSRYQRLHLSRRRGDALRRDLLAAGILEAVVIPTRSGQVVLHELTDAGRRVASDIGLVPGPAPRASLTHAYWAARVGQKFEDDGYRVTHEAAIPGDGAVDLVAESAGTRVAIEVETGKSDIVANLTKLRTAGFERIVLVATSAAAVAACQRAIQQAASGAPPELWTWLDLT
jgi:hypothetical protein